MKKILYTLLLIIMYSGFAQETSDKHKKIFNADLKKANQYFEKACYAKAVPLYEKILSKSRTEETVMRLATSYYNIGDLQASARLYGYLLNRSKKNNTYQNTFKYAQALKASGKYQEAHEVLREYYTNLKDTASVNRLNKAAQKLENIQAIGARYTLKSLSINTPQSEFGTTVYNNNIVFAAAKKEQKKNSIFHGFYGWNNEPFLDIYSISKDSLENANTTPKAISKQVNTKLHEATPAFTSDGKTMYFTRNNYSKNKEIKDNEAVTHLQLYKAHLVDNQWTNIEKLPFNSDNYSIEHPALSPNGDRLYFASDMPSSLGEFDIYYVDILSEDTYGEPVNLGSKINTKHREQFPFIATNGDLYFSSNGHMGFGGLDVFWSKLNTEQFSAPDNLGLPLNSNYDDFAFCLEKDGNKGYISSNRKPGTGSDDIYRFQEEKPLIIEDCKQYVNGLVTDKETNKPVPNATVTIDIIQNKKTNSEKHTSDDNGNFKLETPCNILVKIKAEANGYLASEQQLSIDATRNKNNEVTIALTSLAYIQKKEAEERRKLEEIQKEEERKKQEAKRKKEVQDKINKEKELKNIIASEPLIVEKDNQLLIETDYIHFDYKLWYIRRDVKKILEPVLDLMRKYPNMHIEIESHTDVRGNQTYNKDLSQKRADSTKKYLTEKGIEANRITAIGYGESKPLIACPIEDACSEEEHETNRRSQFVITRIN